MKRFSGANGILLYVLLVGAVFVALAVASVNILDKLAIEEAAAEDRRTELLRVAAWTSREVSKTGDIEDTEKLQEVFRSILEIRASIRRLEVFAIGSDSPKLILSSHPQPAPQPLAREERAEVLAGRSVARFDDSTADRVWVITAPLIVRGHIAGALRARFSIWKYDRLIMKELERAKLVAVGTVVLTSLAFLLLVRFQVHRPVGRLLEVMRRTGTGDLSVRAQLIGTSDMRELASQFNRMLGQIREGIGEKERLLNEIQALNASLETRIVEAVSELQRTNKMLHEAQLQAERSEKLAALGELSAVMAHELGNPLNAISGRLQMLAEETDPTQRDRYLDIVRSEISRMVRTIRHILDSTQVQTRSESIDMNEIIREVLSLATATSMARRIVLKTHLMPGLPRVAGDRTMLHGMVFNLIANALQSMPNGGELVIETRESADYPLNGYVVLSGTDSLLTQAVRFTIRDTGHGIEPDRLSRIFEPFFTTRQREGGTGLGLAICRRVVSSIGGRFVVESTVGIGTAFTIDLPITNALQEDHHGW